MKTICINILFIISMLLVISCTEVGVIEENIPFDKKYVVNGRLKAQSENIEISFSKSFALDENYTKSETAIENLTTYLWSENQGIFPLIHVGDGIYSQKDEIEIRPGQTYELHARIGDDRVYASTYIPVEPDIQEIQITENFIICKIIPNPNTVYGCKFSLVSIYNSSESLIENIFYEISDAVENIADLVIIRTSELPEEYFENSKNYKINLEVYAFDEDYKDYFDTRLNNKPVENIFSEGGGSVFWNVQGDNVIGMFIGYNLKTLNNVVLD
ncbi:MAG: DUF4249 family protein [Ignavibacteriae bacterium]|nr:DUF4249 family protein [Ignavibacteriota bacterium]MCB9209743.1 DUF4249 family protein [Ignavibacteriales bacterium]MCB9218899.1 DUF4249 family protein [Ignavibacteriales bacterium]